MFFRTSTQTRRRICGAMVLVWLFAVLTSAVNACVLSEHDHHELQWHGFHDEAVTIGHDHHRDVIDEPAPNAHDDDTEHGVAAEHAGSSEHSHHDEGAAGCHKFCKDESATLTKNKSLDSPNFSFALIDTGSSLLLPAQTAMPSQRTQERPQAHGPPLIIRFLRLTL